MSWAAASTAPSSEKGCQANVTSVAAWLEQWCERVMLSFVLLVVVLSNLANHRPRPGGFAAKRLYAHDGALVPVQRPSSSCQAVSADTCTRQAADRNR